VANEKASQGFAPGDHASTFGGNPLACAVANKVLDILGQAGFMQQVVENAGYLKQELEKIVDPRIVELRGKGFMLGIEFNCEVKELIEICRQQGLLLLGAGPRVLRLVPPLTVSKDEIDLATITLQRALEKWN
jgi:acetylornithine/N-succinyldiaminopimelate aminotransferase